MIRNSQHISECFVSASEPNPWMAVDLLAETAISTVVILSKDLAGDWDSLFSRYSQNIKKQYNSESYTTLPRLQQLHT